MLPIFLRKKKKNPRFNNNKQKYFIVIKYLFIVLCKDEREKEKELFMMNFINFLVKERNLI